MRYGILAMKIIIALILFTSVIAFAIGDRLLAFYMLALILVYVMAVWYFHWNRRYVE